jgi:uncharacterized membrane protein YhaH (DUF805 family)
MSLMEAGRRGFSMRAMLSLMFLPFGRASRITFLGGIGALVLLSPLASLIIRPLFGSLIDFNNLHLVMWSSMLFSAWVMFCLFANRLHDIGRSALWAVAPIFLPVLVIGGLGGFTQTAFGWGGILTIFVGPVLYLGLGALLLFFRGHDAPNRFGVRPAIV